MAEIFEKIVDVDKCLILDPRQAVQRKLADSIVDEWSDIRVGMFWSMTTASNDNAIPTAESVTINSRLDIPFFGLKNWYDLGETSGDPNEVAPGFSGTVFIGRGRAAADPAFELFQNATTSWQLRTNGPNNWTTQAYYETATKGAGTGEGERPSCPYDPTGDTDYAGYTAFRLVLTGRGTSAQAMTMSVSSNADETAAYTDVSANALRQMLVQSTYSGSQAVTWNDGSLPYEIPNALYIRWPFYVNRLRIHCVGILRVS